MKQDFFSTGIEFLKGVGPQRAGILKTELAIHTFYDLIHHFPYRYVDRTRFYHCSDATADLPFIQIKGQLRSLVLKGEKHKMYLTGKFEDDTGVIELKWFKGLRYLNSSLRLNSPYIMFGKPNWFNGSVNIIHPEMELLQDTKAHNATALQPLYNTTEKMKGRGLDSRSMLRFQRALLEQMPVNIPETLSDDIIKRHALMSLREAFLQIHFPSSIETQQSAAFRIKFEELFYIQLKLLKLKQLRSEKLEGIVFEKVGELFKGFYSVHLPFPLTGAQKKVIKEIRKDCGAGKQMNRLLQGDVGSGKTLVAFMCMLLAADNGYQSCIMAPTEILATQHAETLSELAKELPLTVALLTGSVKGQKRKQLLEELKEGRIDILVGTHALLEDEVQFSKLGFVVIDEQHRFGVEQRAKIWKKNTHVPHVLVMTATPIPRTLAMTLYGDLDYSVIDEMPPGRKEVLTVHRKDADRLQLWGFVREQIAKGRQIYIVYPLIEESEKSDLKNLQKGYEGILHDFPLPHYKTSIVHGKMKAKEKEFEMRRFLNKETQIMVATTVIEVGVNVPNASVMIIENAERFGLSQLHQLRGRVGRGADQSYCILMTSDKLGNDARKRIRTMCESNDGFLIAEADLELRGPGDAEGTRQSGMLDLKLSNITKDQDIIVQSREVALDILKKDPRLNSQQNRAVKEKLEQILRKSGNWSLIS